VVGVMAGWLISRHDGWVGGWRLLLTIEVSRETSVAIVRWMDGVRLCDGEVEFVSE